MLFARFLAETELLIEPKSGVAISLAECHELARAGGRNWLDLAAEYAQLMLPQIFRTGDPVLEVVLPPETRSELEDLMKALPTEVFLADDSLGWVYQYWQADRKEAINRSEEKIGAEALPAVTQLFTEDYMVFFLLHNTLGAWWAGKVLAENPTLAASAGSEEELRAACAVGSVTWTYLRFVRAADQRWRPAAGIFEGWPKAAKNVTVIDPCMGSGHFLVFALPILVEMRIAEEGIPRTEAVAGVLQENIFGLELDPRCAQIGVFNLALAAWKAGGFQSLPGLHIACSGLAPGVPKNDWLALTGSDTTLGAGLGELYDLFLQAPILGSLINPGRIGNDLITADFSRIEKLFHEALRRENVDRQFELTVAAQGIAKAAHLLAGKFTLLVTNVPYLVKGKQNDALRAFCDRTCNEGASDLATVFLRRCRYWGATYATVLPQNWLYQKAYTDYRREMLSNQTVLLVGAVGSGATATASWDVLRCLSIIDPVVCPTEHSVIGIETDAADDRGRAAALVSSPVMLSLVANLYRSEGSKILVGATIKGKLLSDYANSFQGIKTGDDARLRREFWEVSLRTDRWLPMQGSVSKTKLVDGLSGVVDMDSGGAQLARKQGLGGWARFGVSASQMRDLPASFYWGTPFDSNVSAIVPRDPALAKAVWAYCSSPDYAIAVRRIDKSLAATNASMVQVPFDVAHWREVGQRLFGEAALLPESEDPTQWHFHGFPQEESVALHVAIALLLGFEWPALVKDIELSEKAAVFIERTRALMRVLDDDGVLCIPPLRGQAPAADRLWGVLAQAFGVEWSSVRQARMLAAQGFGGKTLNDWVRDGFFEQHCDLFHQRPFIWHIWDGLQHGFSALVNYHRLTAPNGEGRRTLEKLIYTYLGNWIDEQRAEQRAGAEGADLRLAAAEKLKTELVNILVGEPPYDLFVRWKPLVAQPIGWEPDVNDGVRMNIRPFMAAKPLGARAKGACILRTSPKIKWEKDRGKEPQRPREDFPWFWGWDGSTENFEGAKTFEGNRWNDLHYSRSFKEAARARSKK
jgi:hypothetical protein